MGGSKTCKVKILQQIDTGGLLIRVSTSSGPEERNCTGWSFQGDRDVPEADMTFTISGGNCLAHVERYCGKSGTFNSDECKLTFSNGGGQSVTLTCADHSTSAPASTDTVTNTASQTSSTWVVAVVIAVVLIGAVIAWLIIRRRRTEASGDDVGLKYSNHTMNVESVSQSTGEESKPNPLYGSHNAAFESDSVSGIGSEVVPNTHTTPKPHNYEEIDENFGLPEEDTANNANDSAASGPDENTYHEIRLAGNQDHVGAGDSHGNTSAESQSRAVGELENSTVDNILYNS